jgi:UDP-glucose 4-epimerase
MTWLVTGGAGYIGAHLIHAFRAQQADVVVLDDFSTGVSSRLPADGPVERCNLLDPEALKQVFSRHDVTGVVHLAAKKQVDESVLRRCTTTTRTSRGCVFSWPDVQQRG